MTPLSRPFLLSTPSTRKTLSLLVLATLILDSAIAHAANSVTCVETGNWIEISRHDRPVLRYQKTARVPEGVDPQFARSGYLHPIYTPSGQLITDGYPLPHHSHQHGVFFAWRSATLDGQKLNFWEHGRDTVRHEAVLQIFNREDSAGFIVRLAHVSGDRRILEETWTVRVMAETGWIDFRSEQTCLTEWPLQVDRFHYGGMAVRGSRQWFSDADPAAGKGAVLKEFVEPCRMLTSEGLNQTNGNHSRPEWVCMSGRINGAPVALTLIPHPGNFRHPQAVRLHPQMPYFCFLPSVDEGFTIQPGIPYVSRFLIVVEDGLPDPDRLNGAQRVFAQWE